MQKITKAVMGAAIIAVAAGAAYAAATALPAIAREAGADATHHFALPGTLTLDAADSDIACTSPCRIESDGKIGYFQNDMTVTFSNVYCEKAGSYKVAIPVNWSMGDAKFSVTVTDNATMTDEAVVEAVMPKNDSPFQAMEFDLEGRVSEGLKTVVFKSLENPSHAGGFNWKSPEFTWTGEGTELPKTFALPGTLTLDAANDDIVCTSPCRVEADGKIGYFKTDMTVTFNNVNCKKAGTYKVAIPADWSTGDAKFSVTVTDNATETAEATLEAVMPKNNTSFEVMEFDLEGRVSEGLKTVVFKSLENPSHESGFNWKSPVFTWTGEGEIPVPGFVLPGTLTLDAANDDIVCTDPCRVEADGKIGYFKTDMTVTFNNVTCEKAGTYRVAIPVDWSVGDAKFSVTVTDNATETAEATFEAVMPKNNTSFEVMTFDLEGIVSEGIKTVVFKSLENPSHESGFNWKSPEFTWTGTGSIPGTELDPVVIPTEKDKFIDWNMCTFNGTPGKVENGGANIGSTGDGTTAIFKLQSEKDAQYTISFKTGAKGTAIIDVTISDLDGKVWFTGKHNVENTGSWTPSIPFEADTETLPAGTYLLKLYAHDLAGSSYAGNWGDLAIREISNEVDEWGGPLDWDYIPGELPIDNWSYSGARLEGGKPASNVGYVKNGCWAKHKFFCRETGVYSLNINFTGIYDGGQIQIVVTDQATGKVEADNIATVAKENGPQDFMIEGVLTKGKKDIQLNFISNTGGFLFNYKEPVVTKVGEKFAKISSLTFEDGTPVAMEGYDWNFNLPLEYSKETMTVKVDHICGTVAASMEGGTVTDNGDGTFTIPTPARSAEAVVKFVITPEEGAISNKTEYLMRVYHIGDIILTGLDINGLVMDETTIKRFNDKEENIKLEGYVFTAMPKVTAKFIDGSIAEATGTLNEAQTEATYTFQGKAGDFTADFTFTLPGFHMYTKAEGDLDYKVAFDRAAVQSDGSWNNGLFSLNPCNDGWDGTQFKMKGNTTVTLGVPTDMRIKQLRMAQLGDNYGDGRVASVTSEGATCWTPSDAFFTTGDKNRYDLIINVEDHTPGTPFEITFDGGNQPVAWFEFLYEEVVPQDAPTLVKSSATSVADRNHAVVTFTFDRAMADATINVNGTAVKAYGGTTDLAFAVWDLPYSSTVTVTLPAGAAQDKYGNKTDDDYTVTLKVGEKAAVKALEADRFTVVSDVTELRAAVAALAATNNSADAAWSVIFMRNGDYDLGSDVLHLKNLYNVALIGESQEGVLMHGYKTGISDPTFSTRYSTNIYMENFTSRNDLDFGKPERAGVGVAHYGGNLDVMKNVTLQSVQDTQVTGELGYYVNVTMHGTVDYICGGGDHFYDHCHFIMEHEGGVIAAPATSPSLKHGYVFQGCDVSGKDNFHLGRPWQNEPRAFFLNTVMKAQPNEEGWRSMGNLPTHFFEYNSMDADGNALDLSKRINSPTSTNTYSPILPEEYADYFTVRNVLGGKDSWEAAEMTAVCEAPVVYTDGTQLTWEAVENAAGYLVFADGKFLAMTPDCEYTLPAARAEVVYTVAAINGNAARGTMSEAAKEAQGIIGIDADNAAAVEYFNLQGIRVDANTTGTVIRVTRAADGSRKAEKIYKR